MGYVFSFFLFFFWGGGGGLRVLGLLRLGFRPLGILKGLGDGGLGVRVWGLRVWGLGFRVCCGLGFRV